MHLGGLLSAQELEVSPRATLTLLSKYANLKNLEMISCNKETLFRNRFGTGVAVVFAKKGCVQLKAIY